MPEIKIPDDELKKLADLIGLRILQPDQEEAYRLIIEFAVSIMEVPYAGISLSNPDRQWIKTPVGFTYTTAPNESAFYKAVTSSPKEPTICQDASLDDRFKHERSVQEGLNVRFYLGIPVVSRDGYVIGLLGMADNVPRKEPTSYQLEMCQHLTSFLVLYSELRDFLEDIFHEIQELKSFPVIEGHEAELHDLFGRLDDVLTKVKKRRKLIE